MQKVKMKTLDAGPNGVRIPGQVVDVDAKEAQALVDGGYAEYVEKKQEVGEPDGAEADNGTGRRTGKSGRGKNVSED